MLDKYIYSIYIREVLGNLVIRSPDINALKSILQGLIFLYQIVYSKVLFLSYCEHVSTINYRISEENHVLYCLTKLHIWCSGQSSSLAVQVFNLCKSEALLAQTMERL